MRLGIVPILLAGLACAQNDRSPELQVAAFSCDITPPIGHPMAGGLLKQVEGIEAPLQAKGIVLSDGKTRYVLCALDWCRVHNEAYDLFRRKIAAAAEVTESRVAVQCLHQHDAPVADVTAQRLLEAIPDAPKHLDISFLEKAADHVASAVRAALPRLQTFTHVGYGKGKVEKFASTRRVITPDGKIMVRSSQAKDPALHEAPEGKIDPWVRTVTFFDHEKPLVRLHYYACHPQNNYGDGKVDPDVFEPIRARLEKEEGNTHIYFAGCGGDVSIGKYNVGTPREVHDRLIDRMCAGIKRAVADTRKAAVSEIGWKTTEAKLVPRREPAFSEEAMRKEIADPKLEAPVRIKAAWTVSWYERVKVKPGIEVSRLRLGPVQVLHLPGEACIEYQLYAQSLRPDDFVAVAAYGDGGPSYICTDEAFAQGGYEPTVSWVGPPTEQRLKAAIEELLR